MNAILVRSEIPKGLDHGLAWIRESRVIFLCSWVIVWNFCLSAALASPKCRKFWMISLKNGGNLVIFFMLRYRNKLGRIHKENGM